MGSIDILDMGHHDIYPVYGFDDSAINRIMVTTCLLRYDAVLDAQQLQESLSLLVHTNNWKKLRGRLRLNADERLEIHVPQKSSWLRPPFRYRQTMLGLSIQHHPLFAQLAQPQSASSVQPALASLKDISSVLVPPDWPQTFDDYVDTTRDEPILGLHVLSFVDSTVVVLTYSHVVMDGGGMASLLDAWSRALHDPATIPPLAGLDEDPLDAVRREFMDEASVLDDQKIQLATLMPEEGQQAQMDPLWDTASPASQWRTISLSPRALSTLKAEAMARSSFASEDDMVAAWCLRTVARLLPPSRALNAMRVYDMRPRLSVFSPAASYIQNAFQMAWTLFPSASRLTDSPLGQTAVHLRNSLTQQTTPGQVKAAMHARSDGATPLYGDAAGLFFTLNSWVRMELYRKADFGPAVVGETKGQAKGARPEFIDVDFHLGGAPPGPNIIFTGKDERGYRHAKAFLSSAMWPKMEAEIKRLG